MVKNNVKNHDRLWQDFEKSGSINAFLTYHQSKLPENASKRNKAKAVKAKVPRK